MDIEPKELIGLIAAIITIGVTVYALYSRIYSGVVAVISRVNEAIYTFFNKFFSNEFTWKKLMAGMEEIIQFIGSNHFEPQIIIGYGRGGAIMAGVLSKNITKDRIPFVCYDLDFEWNERGRKELIDDIIHHVEGRKVLLVISRTSTGATLREITKKLEDLKPLDVRTCCLISSGNETFKADYCAFKNVNWKEMPWHIREDYDINYKKVD